MNVDGLYRFCVYTIASRDHLDAAAAKDSPFANTEGRRWVAAEDYLEKSKSEGVRVPIVLGNAQDCSELLYWGLLTGVELQPSSTRYTVDRLRPLRAGHAPQELVRAKNDEHIAPGFIRPYVLCHTPSFLTESTTSIFLSPEENGRSETFSEGASVRISVNAYERDSRARKKCIERYGCECVACGFDFEKTYGEIGQGFIHVHHLMPLSEASGRHDVDPIRDLRPVCPNCHAMLHARSPLLSIEELRASLRR